MSSRRTVKGNAEEKATGEQTLRRLWTVIASVGCALVFVSGLLGVSLGSGADAARQSCTDTCDGSCQAQQEPTAPVTIVRAGGPDAAAGSCGCGGCSGCKNL